MVGARVSQRTRVSFVQFQLELCPNTERTHFQVYVQFDKSVSFSKVKEFFFFNDKQHHVDACRGSSDDNLKYTSKEESRIAPTESYGECRSIAAGKGRGHRTDLAEFKTDVDSGIQWNVLLDKHFETMATCHNFCRIYFDAVQEQTMLQDLKENLNGTTLRAWQSSLVNLVQRAPDARRVHWFHESVGNIGKSWMARYLAVAHQAIVLQSMKKSDMIHLLAKRIRSVDIVVFDLCRSCEDGAVTVVYEVMEMLKNGYLCSGKYDSNALTFKTPHVVVFANFEPDRTKLSADRWCVHHLTGVNLMLEFELQP